MNRNEGLHSALRGKLNGLARRTKGYSKADGTLTLSIALAWLKSRLIYKHARVGNTIAVGAVDYCAGVVIHLAGHSVALKV